MQIERLAPGYERVFVGEECVGVLEIFDRRWVFSPSFRGPKLTAVELQQLASYLAAKGDE